MGDIVSEVKKIVGASISGTTDLERAVSLAELVGLRVELADDQALPHAVRPTYDGETIWFPASELDEGLVDGIVHEVAHYLVADRSRRHLPNFGFAHGPGLSGRPTPGLDEKNRLMGPAQEVWEERYASALHMLLEAAYGMSPDYSLFESQWKPRSCPDHLDADYADEGRYPPLACPACWPKLHRSAGAALQRAASASPDG